jgi:hypothetical protein
MCTAQSELDVKTHKKRDGKVVHVDILSQLRQCGVGCVLARPSISNGYLGQEQSRELEFFFFASAVLEKRRQLDFSKA